MIQNVNMTNSTNAFQYFDVLLYSNSYFLAEQHNMHESDLPKTKKNVHVYIYFYILIC